MISNLALFLADKFVSNKDTDKDEQELYIYGLFMFLSHFIYFVLVCVFGTVLKCVFESILFYISFNQIRRYAGGYHAKTELRCEICSTVVMFSAICIIKISQIFNIYFLFYFAVIASVTVFFLSPLDTMEKPLSEKEFIFFRKKSKISLNVILLAALVSYLLKKSVICFPCSMSIIVESILLIAGKINRKKTESCIR